MLPHAALVCTAVALGLWLLFFSLYWPHRDRFNETGVYFDEVSGIVHHEQSGLLVVPAVALSLLAALLAGVWLIRRLRRAQVR